MIGIGYQCYNHVANYVNKYVCDVFTLPYEKLKLFYSLYENTIKTKKGLEEFKAKILPSFNQDLVEIKVSAQKNSEIELHYL